MATRERVAETDTIAHRPVRRAARTITRLKVDSLTIRNFRNIAAIDVAIPASGVVIIGQNGAGKTNLLEAIYYLVLFRSLRGARDRDLVRFGTDGFFVAGSANARVTAGYEVHGAKKKITVDGVAASRLGEAVGHLVAVPFAPTDREIVSGGPAGRRRYLDVLLALSSRAYFRHLSALRAALKQRNAALRTGSLRVARSFDHIFAQHASMIARQRIDWISGWSDRFAEICSAMGERETPTLAYQPHGWEPNDDPDSFVGVLSTQLDRDGRRGTTSIGPHRDDITLRLGGRSLRTHGSAGQQRTAAIALRILEGETLSHETGHTPIALYDDVFVELDAGRHERLLELIRDALPGQAIITAPRESEVPRALFDRPRWTMHGGRLAAA